MGTEADNLALLDETINRSIALEIPVEAHLVPMHCNYKQIPDVLSKLYSMGLKNVSLLRLVPQGRVLENKEMVVLSAEEQDELKQLMTDCQEIYQDKIRLGLPFSAKCAACGTGTVKLTVRYDGFVFPCEAFKDGIMEINECVRPENVKEKRLKDIYDESKYLHVVREGRRFYSRCEGNEYCFGQFYRNVRDLSVR